LRIVGGKWAGRHLTSPADRRVRPTAEHVRDAWLTALEPELKGALLLDLFAGTGALGLEAMSRGAKECDFVETRPASLHALKANVAALHVRERSRIFKRDALPFAAALPAGRYDVAFADPPYESRQLDRLLESWKAVPFARILAVEHALAHELPPGGKRLRFEDTAVTIYRARIPKPRPAPRPDVTGSDRPESRDG
jgi:16S rRNA (guanine966-N2)-methyltransferase